MSGKQIASLTKKRPVAPEYNIAMQQLTNLSCTTTKQHKGSPDESMKSTLSVPKQSLGHLISPDYSLRDLVTGGMTGEGVNMHDNEYVRCKYMHKYVGQPALTLSLGRPCKGCNGRLCA